MVFKAYTYIIDFSAYDLPGLPTPRESPVPDDESRGSSGSWDANVYDPDIPNATHWTVNEVMDYFNSKGFSEFSSAFHDQVIKIKLFFIFD